MSTEPRYETRMVSTPESDFVNGKWQTRYVMKPKQVLVNTPEMKVAPKTETSICPQCNGTGRIQAL